MFRRNNKFEGAARFPAQSLLNGESCRGSLEAGDGDDLEVCRNWHLPE